MDVKQHSTNQLFKATELRSCVKVEVDVVPTVSVDVKQHFNSSRRRPPVLGVRCLLVALLAVTSSRHSLFMSVSE